MSTVQVIHPAAGVSTVKVVHGTGAQVIHPAAAAATVKVVYANVIGMTTGAQAVSTDGTDSLPAPSGVGLEFVITATGLDDIRYNGTSL